MFFPLEVMFKVFCMNCLMASSWDWKHIAMCSASYEIELCVTCLFIFCVNIVT